MDNLPLIIALLVSGSLGALGTGSYFYLKHLREGKERRAHLAQHLEQLQRLVSKLLNACDLLLKGDTPADSALYQRFKLRGGEYHGELQMVVYEAIQHGQQALDAAFDIHQKLINPTVQQNRSLEQRIWDWEMLYAMLVGRRKNIQNLTAEELSGLLDPVLTTSTPKVSKAQLTKQLNALRRELAGMPLKIEWQMIDPTQLEAEGILGYIEQAKIQIGHLPDHHRQQASRWLAAVVAQYQVAKAESPHFLTELYHYITGPAPFRESATIDEATFTELTSERLFEDIQNRLKQMELALEQEQFLDVIEQADNVWQDIGILKVFLQALDAHGRRESKIEAITAQGYAPPRLEDHRQIIRTNVKTITQHILATNYAATPSWIEQLNTDSEYILANALAWQELHDWNIANLESLKHQVANLAQYWQEEVSPAWQTLQSYPQQNWANLADEMERAEQTFQRLRYDYLEQIQSLNSIEVQKFTEAEQMLSRAQADLAQVEQQFHTIVNRLTELQAAEAHIVDALRLTEADLLRVKTLRDREDVKIGPEVDRQIEQATQQLAEAKRLAEASQFIAALNLQAATRRLATTAYVAADEQVREINNLQETLERLVVGTQKEIERSLSEIERLPSVAQTASTNRLNRQLHDKLSAAERARMATTTVEDKALAKALQSAIDAYHEVEQLAKWVRHQLSADHQEYKQELDRTLAALSEARAAIRQAEKLIHKLDEPEIAWYALEHAQSILSPVDITENATKEALIRIRQQAEEAHRYARYTEAQIEQTTGLSGTRRRLQQPDYDDDERTPASIRDSGFLADNLHNQNP